MLCCMELHYQPELPSTIKAYSDSSVGAAASLPKQALSSKQKAQIQMQFSKIRQMAWLHLLPNLTATQAMYQCYYSISLKPHVPCRNGPFSAPCKPGSKGGTAIRSTNRLQWS